MTDETAVLVEQYIALHERIQDPRIMRHVAMARSKLTTYDVARAQVLVEGIRSASQS